jgi:hypothetical protein
MNKDCQHIIIPIQKAISDKSTIVTLYVYKLLDAHGMFRHQTPDVQETISVPNITIDEFFSGRPIDIIKMDIERNEPFVLEGMKKNFQNSKNLILITEFNPTFLNQAGINPKDYVKQIKSFGFNIKIMDEHAKVLHSITIFDDFLKGPYSYANLFFIK